MEQTTNTKQQRVVTEQPCPRCQAMIPVHPHYVSWCDKCGWNVQPVEGTLPRTIFETMQASIGKRYSTKLLEALLQTDVPQSRWTLSRLAAYLLAAMIHILPLLVAALGIFLLSVGQTNLAGLVVTPVPTWSGLTLLAFAYVLLPRPTKFPNGTVSRAEFPELYELADRVAMALGAPQIHGIVIHEGFGASFLQAGWRRRAMLLLGLPLFHILDNQEKVALVAHELAHRVNGDPTRNLIVGAAIESLVKWYEILIPDQLAPVEYGLTGYLLVPFNLLRAGLAYGARFIMQSLAHLVWRDAQRAEYRADYLAASISGTNAALSLLHKLGFDRTFHTTLRRVYLNWDNQNLFEEFQGQLNEVPERELERIRQVERLQESRLDIVHPPTCYRMDFLRAHPVEEAKVILASSEGNQIEQEVARMETKIQKRLLDAYALSIGGSRRAPVPW